jgi:hypothetical protein
MVFYSIVVSAEYYLYGWTLFLNYKFSEFVNIDRLISFLNISIRYGKC